jgi:hypothetical protein
VNESFSPCQTKGVSKTATPCENAKGWTKRPPLTVNKSFTVVYPETRYTTRLRTVQVKKGITNNDTFTKGDGYLPHPLNKDERKDANERTRERKHQSEDSSKGRAGA